MLKNNHKEMKTVVETFIIEETAPLIYDNEQLDKWNEHVKVLGLEGQTKIVKPKKSPIPFMHMKSSMELVFKTLCPKQVDVRDYDVTPIPVEILDLVALSVNEKYFDEIQIWYDEKTPDPVCVGMNSSFYIYSYANVPKELTGKTVKDKATAMAMVKEIRPDWNEKDSIGWTSDHIHYLIGKWGDVKHSFEQLKKMAIKRHVDQEAANYKAEIKRAQQKLDSLQEDADQKYN